MQLAVVNDSAKASAAISADRPIGADPETGKDINLKTGPYGPYLQLGAAEGKKKPKRASLPKGLEPDSVDLDIALKLLSLPREISAAHPETGKPITAAIGRYGPYVQNDGLYASLESWEDLFEIGENRAISMLAEVKEKQPALKEKQRELGQHPDKKSIVIAGTGRYGPFVKVGRTYASLPKDLTVDSVTLEQAIQLLAPKLSSYRGKGKGASKKKVAKKKSAGK